MSVVTSYGLPEGLVLRDYEPKDDAGCRQLEVTASQFQGFGGLIKAAIQHKNSFDTKPRQFVQHLLLVVVDERANSAVAAVVVMAIKNAFVHGAVERCGFVFDLRVAEPYQRQGIGKALTSEVEKRAISIGVCYLYLSVNNSNKKARSLYASQGWTQASSRSLLFKVLISQPRKDAAALEAASKGGGVLKMERGKALALATEHFARRDLGLTAAEFERLFASESYLGTWVAEDGAGSLAALSLWDGSKITTFTPINLILPMAWWARLSPLPSLLAAAGAAGVASALLRAAPGPLVQSAIVAGCILIGVKVVSFWHWWNSRKGFRARAFAPCVSGPQWKPLMRAVHAQVCTQARELGFATIVINEDSASELVACVGGGGKPKSQTSFWQKRIPAPPVWSIDSALPSMHSDAFFDPRDI